MTRLQANYFKWLTALLIAFALIAANSAAYAAPLSDAAHTDGAAEYRLFLEEKYGISLTGPLTKGDFIEAVAAALGYESTGEEAAFTDLKTDEPLYPSAAALYENGVLNGPAIEGERALTNSVAISIAVRAADLKELAYTYPVQKVNQSLKKLQISSSGLGAHVAQELAAAIDTGLLPEDYYANFNPWAKTDEKLANVLLGKILEIKGLYKNYIGYIGDADIFAKLNAAYAASDIIHAPKLQELVNEALEQELVTGYNLKDSRFKSNFIDSLSITYGHSDFTHAVQLIGLLRSEGLNAKVQFEPKTSAYVHLAEWGDPGPNVVQIENGNYIAYSKEYDLVFEFFTEQDKAAFQDIILAYAKKNENGQTGLIAGSWWQPLYFSATKLEDYKVITNNLITDPDGYYEVHPFSLNEDSAKVVEGFKAIDPDVTITPYQFWVDQPFFNYLHGEAL